MIKILLNVPNHRETKMRMRSFVATIAAIAMLGGCANLNFSKEDQGTVIGGVAGGVLGSMLGGGRGNILGAIIGTFTGGYLGRTVGRQMDDQEKMLHARAVEEAIVHGRSATWHNPRTGHRGRAHAGPRYQTQRGECREYQSYITIDGREVPAHGTACPERDGSWRITN